METPKLRVRTPYGNIYIIHKMGEIERTDMQFHPTMSWRLLGIRHVKRNEFISLNKLQFLAETNQLSDWTRENLLYKNGNPQWTGVDFDHGTKRVWGNTKYHGIKSITL